MKHWIILITIVIFLPATGCRHTNLYEPIPSWTYADLRLIDPVDAIHVSSDIVAVYLYSKSIGSNKSELNVRLDFLDLSPMVKFDLYLAVDYFPGGNLNLPIRTKSKISWENLVIIRAGGEIETYQASKKIEQLSVRILRDPELDIVTLQLSGKDISFFSPNVYVQVFLTLPGSTLVADQTEPVYLSGFPPTQAPILFTFWNTLPAYTPIQALRRWDGAHSGPYGGRHGLYNLLKNSNHYGVPVVLLDLKYPASLSALDFIGGTQLIQELVEKEILILPDTAPVFPVEKPLLLPDWMLVQTIQHSQLTATRFGLPSTPFRHAQFTPLQSPVLSNGYRLIFSPQKKNQTQRNLLTTVHRQGDFLVIPYPVYTSTTTPFEQATPEGPSLELRQSFVQLASSLSESDNQDSSQLLILGGDLPASSWGDPESARTSFAYIKAHPWIRIMNATDLLTAKVSSPGKALQTSNMELSQEQRLGLEKLNKIGENHLGKIAWQSLESLLSPTFPSHPSIHELRDNYWRQLYSLINLQDQRGDFKSGADCHVDIDQDGNFECILSNSNFTFVFERENGNILYGFVQDDQEFHQLLAPSSQFTSGQSDPSNWKLGQGLSSDPAVIPGAFLDDGGPYNVNYRSNEITFFSSNTVKWKQFRLLTDRLVINYETTSPIQVKIPLALDPWVRFTPGWSDQYKESITENGWQWGLKSGVGVEIRTTEKIEHATFMDTRNQMRTTEDPNAEKAPGNYLPFPLALVTINGEGRFSIEFILLQ